MISIIIPTAFQGGKYLSLLLPIVTHEPNCQVIVVDNASTDNTHEICSGYPIVYIKNIGNLGFAKACNNGARFAKGDYLLFLNNDTYPEPMFTRKMLEVFHTPLYNRGAEMGIVGVKLRFLKDGTVQHGGIHFNHEGFAYEIRDVPTAEKEREVNAVTAACMLVKRSAFERVGGFDEQYVNGWEDVDFCLRLRELGYRIIYTPKTFVKHVHMGSPDRLKHENSNRNLYKAKWVDTGKIFQITGKPRP